MRTTHCLTAIGIIAMVNSFLVGGELITDPKSVEFFETKIRPVLVKNCFECHSTSSAKVKGNLLLDSREGTRRGGQKGPAIVPGKPDESLLLASLKHEGLKMPPKLKLPDTVIADFEKWILMGAPDPRDGTMTGYKKLTLEEAKTFWSFTSVSKPETPKVKDTRWAHNEIDRFVLAQIEAKSLKVVPDADKRTLVRRLYFDLLGLPPSPEEVDTFVNDTSSQAVEKLVDRLLASPRFGERWGRHWLDVARYAETNGNADNVPFPQAYRYRDYVIRSVNADKPYDQFIREQIAGDLLLSKDAKEKDDNLLATGFLALTSKPRAQNNPDYRMDLVADQIDVTSRAVLGLSVLCARCHDHKFDPISQKEYYALAGVFDSTQMLFGSSAGKGGGGKNTGGGGFHTLSDDSQAMGVKDGKPTDCKLCIRGESQNLGETVPRGFLTVAGAAKEPVNRSQSGRLELAQWLTSPENPLTSRVAVNRIWMHLFGQGLVKTTDNFGFLGEKPSHPELLNYLASEFVTKGWSVKKTIKTIVMSRTYQLSSGHRADNYKSDPDNVWIWRMNPRRLDAESIRDAMLTVGGNLDLTPPTGSLATAVGKNKRPNYESKDGNVRSVYLAIVRGAPMPESLSIFDVANPNLVVSQREVTTVPAQALFLMNSPFVVAQAKALAGKLLTDSGMDDAARVELAYKICFARSATEKERARALDFIGKPVEPTPEKGKATGAGKEKQLTAWTGLCQAILASAEFRYLE